MFDDENDGAASAAAPTITHVLLLDDWAQYRAGRVLALTDDLSAALDVEHVRHRPATSDEIALGGFSTF